MMSRNLSGAVSAPSPFAAMVKQLSACGVSGRTHASRATKSAKTPTRSTQRKETTMSTLETLSLSALVQKFNACVGKDKQVKKFRDKATAIRRVQEVLKTTKPAKRSMQEFHAERVAQTRSLKITVLCKDNPKRGSAATRYSLYKTGMTVGEYIKLGGQLRDVTWDAKQGWITVK